LRIRPSTTTKIRSVRARALFSASLILAVAGCATYTPAPLAKEPMLAQSVTALQPADIAPQQPLSVSQVAILAVENNADLRAARVQRALAQAQVFSAGRLPDPRVTGAFLPLLAGVGTTPAWNAGIGQDITSLITLSAREQGAKAAARQVDAQILWQEWQVNGQAKLLAVDIIEGETGLGVLAQAYDLLSELDARLQTARLQGLVTLTQTAPITASLQTTRTQADDLARLQLSRRHQLNALLGLAPNVTLPLTDVPDVPLLDAPSVERTIPGIASRRPDLVALQFGYEAQEQRVRTAILAQFPNLIFGVTGGSDNANVRNFGPQVSFTLPIFDRNQGAIAIERATRARLHEEYTARLTTAVGQVGAMLSEIAALNIQRDAIRAELTRSDEASDEAAAAFRSGDLDHRSYVDFIMTRLNKQVQLITIEQSLFEQQIAIAGLTGAGLPSIESLPTETTP
jgi:outer membrane protein TolC